MGVGKEEAAGLSTDVLQLGADLASFNNLDPTVTLEKLRAGLTGEAEGLKALGISLKASEVDHRALELAVADGRTEITEADRIMARYQIIMEQSSAAQGDFARTSDGLANQTRIAKAELADAGAALGRDFLPYALQGIQILRDLVGWFKNLSPETQKTLITILGLAAAVGPLLLVLGSLASGLSSIIGLVTTVGSLFAGIGVVISGPILIAIGLIVGALSLLYLAWQNNFLGIQDIVQSGIDWIVEQFNKLIDTDWAEIGLNIILGIVQGLQAGFTYVSEAVTGLFDNALTVAKNFLGINSPSDVWDAEVGYQMGAGTARGWSRSMRELRATIRTDLGSLIPSGGSHTDRRQYNFYGSGVKSGSDLQRLIRRSDFLYG